MIKTLIKTSWTACILFISLVAVCFAGCQNQNSDGGQNNPPPHTHSYSLTDNGICYFEDNKLYGFCECSCGDDEVKEITNYTSVSPSTIFDYLVLGQANRILVLENGEYDMLELTSVESFDENLIIIARDNAQVRGISITSGSSPVGANSEQDTMPSNLRIIGLTMLNDIQLRNCSMDGLTIYDCDFINGARIAVNPNAFVMESYDAPIFGSDGSAAPESRDASQINKVQNLRIEDCDLTGEKTSQNLNQVTKIHIFDTINITIKNNTIEDVGYNAVQLNKKIGGVGGNIIIEDNEISNVQSRALRFSGVKDNTTIVIKDNDFSNIELLGASNGEVIKISDKGNNVSIDFTGNELDDEQLLQDDGKVKLS